MNKIKPAGECYGRWHYGEPDEKSPPSLPLSIAWSGWTDVATALKESEQLSAGMSGDRYIAFGGGDVAGSFNPCCVDAVTRAIQSGILKDYGYDGVCYCLQEGAAGLSDALEASFSIARQNGFKVLVSCIPPFSFVDANKLMSSLLASDNIDIFSPQLYESWFEPYNTYSVVEGDYDFKNCRAQFVIDLTRPELYREAKQFFSDKGREPEGYILR
ncbi:hypothetical protein [Marinomonas mediterranea]|uniref:hypothetical protein n=1 Tax=Marinomonas mediterranea TaxID=119864 RepID=UPI00234AA79F|nr:hypothetical protein [Marinomonas mediterranea]WCN09892.1 hypothetical protein GV055_13685 [Marinomonas mediterranea]WCN13972.1 hypothetical protein GV054_13675 [Marinomonas mediterranea]